jgi:hypothetical protein
VRTLTTAGSTAAQETTGASEDVKQIYMMIPSTKAVENISGVPAFIYNANKPGSVMALVGQFNNQPPHSSQTKHSGRWLIGNDHITEDD